MKVSVNVGDFFLKNVILYKLFIKHLLLSRFSYHFYIGMSKKTKAITRSLQNVSLCIGYFKSCWVGLF